MSSSIASIAPPWWSFPLLGSRSYPWWVPGASWVACSFTVLLYYPPAGWEPAIVTPPVTGGSWLHLEALLDQVASNRHQLQGSLCCLSLALTHKLLTCLWQFFLDSSSHSIPSAAWRAMPLPLLSCLSSEQLVAIVRAINAVMGITPPSFADSRKHHGFLLAQWLPTPRVCFPNVVHSCRETSAGRPALLPSWRMTPW